MAAHAPVDGAKHGLYYAAGANAAARTDSLSDDGPLLARATSWWAAALGHRLVARAGIDRARERGGNGVMGNDRVGWLLCTWGVNGY